jgi:Protein of unknown function (DUF2933)
MNNQRYMRLAIGVVAAAIVLRVLGVGAGSLGLLAVVLACPLMMFFMMRSMGGMGGGKDDRHDDTNRDDNQPGRV